MAQVINTNISSLNAQRNLNTSQSALQTSLQRLSSGMRINSAKDDAAGLAISERMSSQIRGLDQAQRNANDAVSLTQTAEGALASSGDILQRMRELAVQSANASNTASDRQSIQNEIGQLGSELDRIAQATQFNGKNLFDGTFGTVKFQIGANANQVVDANVSNLRITTYGNNQYGVSGSGTAGLGAGTMVAGAAGTEVTSLTSGTIDINGYIGSSTGVAIAVADSAATIANKVNNVTTSTGVTATARNDVLLSFSATGVYNMAIAGDNASNATEAVTFNISQTNSADGLSEAITAFNDKSAKTGLVASLNSANTGIILSSSAGANIVVEDTAAENAGSVTVQGLKADQVNALGASATLTSDAADGVFVVGQVTFDSPKSFSLTSTDTNFLAAADTTVNSSLNKVSTLDVTTFLNSTQAIKTIDSALAFVNSERAKFGALQNRLTSTIANLAATSENLSASRSRIRDADFAVETASLTRGQILQQAGVAMLSQANAQPNSVLSLLK
ncbi:MAG: flagellin [Sulfuricellaceae bacterium]